MAEARYQLDARMRILFWLQSHLPQVSASNLERVQAQSDGVSARLMARVLLRHYRVAEIADRSIPGRAGLIPLRIYRPARVPNLPVVVFFHGGGWVLGGLESHDAICRRIAAENRALVVAVAYRLAPQHTYPAAVEDAYDATSWVATHATELGAASDKLIVMGDSAGGNLAAVVCLMARDLGGPPIAFQVLIYPSVDFGGEYASKQLYADTPVLPRAMMVLFRDLYIRQPADGDDPYVSPLRSPDLSHLPPALMLMGQYDPLRDEGQAYADRLRAAGTEVTAVCYPHMPHGFLSFGRLSTATPAAFAQLRRTLAPLTSASGSKLPGETRAASQVQARRAES